MKVEGIGVILIAVASIALGVAVLVVSIANPRNATSALDREAQAPETPDDLAEVLSTPRTGTGPNGFDLRTASVPRSQILEGGVPRDGIPAIHHPKFISPEAADYLQPSDPVISVTHDGETRAYPLRILIWHEIVNDHIGDFAFAATYCPLCGTAMVFDRTVNGRTLTFGVSGLLYQSDMLMYDRETQSLWSQIKQEAVAGPQTGGRLAWLPSEHLSFEAWRKKHPSGTVLSTDTGAVRNYSTQPYRGYEKTERTMFPVIEYRTDLPGKEWILGIVVSGQAKAYPVKNLPSGEPIEDRIGETTLTLVHDPETQSYSARLSESGALVPVVKAYWFAWQAFYPETELWKVGGRP